MLLNCLSPYKFLFQYNNLSLLCCCQLYYYFRNFHVYLVAVFRRLFVRWFEVTAAGNDIEFIELFAEILDLPGLVLPVAIDGDDVFIIVCDSVVESVDEAFAVAKVFFVMHCNYAVIIVEHLPGPVAGAVIDGQNMRSGADMALDFFQDACDVVGFIIYWAYHQVESIVHFLLYSPRS